MTPSERETERRYRIAERLGISAGKGATTTAEEMLAKMTVDAEMRQLDKLAEFDAVVESFRGSS